MIQFLWKWKNVKLVFYSLKYLHFFLFLRKEWKRSGGSREADEGISSKRARLEEQPPPPPPPPPMMNEPDLSDISDDLDDILNRDDVSINNGRACLCYQFDLIILISNRFYVALLVGIRRQWIYLRKQFLPCYYNQF